MSKITLILDSQALSAYQLCARKYLFGYEQDLTPVETKKALEKGTLIHAFFEYRNKGLLAGQKLDALLLEIAGLMNEPSDLPREEKLFLYMRFIQYHKYWKLNDQRYKLISCEEGFSKTLYEDDTYLFIYEGRIDATYYDNREQFYFWRDYKSRSQNNAIYTHNNQAMGYSWALEGKGEYDYIGLQADKTKNLSDKEPHKLFERVEVKFRQGALDDWVSNTIAWYHKILEDQRFIKSQSACQTQYGVCRFRHLCERHESLHPSIIQTKYKKREKWKAW